MACSSHTSPLALKLQQAWLQTQLRKSDLFSPSSSRKCKSSSSQFHPRNFVERDPSLDYLSHLLMRDSDPDEEDPENIDEIQKQLLDLIECSRTDLMQQKQDDDPAEIFARPLRASLYNTNNNSLAYQDVFGRLDLPDRDLLVSLIDCAEAVSNGDLCDATKIAGQIRTRASPVGNVSERLASYFVEALAVRISSLGGNICKVLFNKLKELDLRDLQVTVERTPYMRIPFTFGSQVILNSCRGKRKVHVIDYGILFGMQWPILIEELAKLPEPPYLRLTGIDMPPPGFQPNLLAETGSRLEEYARNMGVPFRFSFISAKWEEIEPSRLSLKTDEMLIINCSFRHHNLVDESLMAESPRKIWLKNIRNMNPVVFIQSVKNVDYGAPFLVPRFIEAMIYHAVLFDSFEHCIPRDHPDALKFEQYKYCREILNVVACEGLEMVERAENYRRAHARTLKAGFKIMSLDPQLLINSQESAGSYHKEFKLSKDGEWMILSWKDQPVHAYSAWVPDSKTLSK